MCDIPVYSCRDVLRANESAESGVYQIALGSETNTKNAYCYFHHSAEEVWTLVMSYKLSYEDTIGSLQFTIDKTINEANPTFNEYRASLNFMKYLKNKSSSWRATCNHDTKPFDDDYVQNRFTTLDIMTYRGKRTNTIESH